MHDIVLPFAVCLLAGLALTPIARAVVHRLDPRRNVPPVGGTVLMGMFLPLGVLYAGTWGFDPILRARAAALVGGCAVLWVVGEVNDRRTLRGRQMLLGQCLAVGVALACDLTVPEFRVLGWQVELGAWGKVVAGGLLLAAVNAFRSLDQMDGLVTCLGVIVAAALALMAHLHGQPAAAAAAAATTGGLCGLLRSTWPPATVRLGSAGSMLVGLIVGVLATASSVKGPTAVTLAAPTALLTIPLFDFGAGLIRRRLTGRGLYTKDRDHLAHCLQRRGLGQRRVVAVVALLCLVTAAGALAAQVLRNEVYALLGAGTVVAILIVTRLFGHAELTLLGQHLRATAYSFLPTGSEATGSGDDAVLFVTATTQRPTDRCDRFWGELLADCAAPLDLKEIGLNVVAGGDEFAARWHVAGRYDAGRRLWRAEMPIEVDGRAAGRLDIVGFADGRSHGAKLAELAGRVRQFAAAGQGGGPAAVNVLEATLLDRGAATFAVNVARLRVCHLGKFYPPAVGGIETHVRTLARAQAALGADVRVLCTNHADPTGTDATERRFARTRTGEEFDGPVRVARIGRFASLAKLDVCPRLALALRRLMDDPPHLLHLHTPNPTMLLAVACFCPALPLVVTHHSDVVRQRLLHYPYAVFERLVYGRASRILATSPAYAAGSATLAGFRDSVEVLPLGLDRTPFAEPSPAAVEFADHLRRKHAGPLWLAVGRLTYYKGFDVALEALARVPGRLLLIGTGPLLEALHHRAAELGVEGRVVWHGHATADELVGAYLAATALWFPSNARSEGFGLVQVEAMAAGCPVINAAIPDSGVPWVARDGEEALTVPVNAAAALGDAARRLLDEPGLRDRLVRAGRARAAAEFDHAVMARRSLAVYERALAGAPAARP